MEIVEIPDPVLRKKSKQVTEVDKKLLKFVDDLQSTLANTTNPKGGGLAAPQVGKLWRIFTTQVGEPMVFINPVITKHSKEKVAGIDDIMEGCLSMPKLWGEVPRWTWVDLEYDQIQNDKLVRTKKRFESVQGVFIQHEVDHLDGVLFTDYSLKYDLPVYRQVEKEKFEEVDKTLLEVI